MAEPEILVSIPSADVGVHRDEDGLWLALRLGRGGTLLSNYQPAVAGLAERRTLAGGRLPPGAVATEVVDDLGDMHRAAAANGAWVIILDQPTDGSAPPVRHLDEAGESVRPPLPDDWAREPVLDAAEPCPACDACDWESVQPRDGSRGMYAEGGVEPELDPPPPGSSRWIPTPFVACRSCGHEEGGGSTFIGPLDEEGGSAPEEEQELTRRFEREHRRRKREALEKVGFLMYAPDRVELTLSGWGGGPEGINRVRVTGRARSGAEVEVETRVGEAIFEYPRDRVVEAVEELLEREGDDEEWPLERSEPGPRVWLETQRRKNRARRRRLMGEIERRQTEILVGGSPQPVEYAEVDGRWSAAFDRDQVAVTVSSSDAPIEDVRLLVVEDPLDEFGSANS